MTSPIKLVINEPPKPNEVVVNVLADLLIRAQKAEFTDIAAVLVMPCGRSVTVGTFDRPAELIGCLAIAQHDLMCNLDTTDDHDDGGHGVG